MYSSEFPCWGLYKRVLIDASDLPEHSLIQEQDKVHSGVFSYQEHVHLDWLWIAAARIVAEWNIRQNVPSIDAVWLDDWNGFRGGAWVSGAPKNNMCPERRGESSPEEAGERSKPTGWDWAGVEGKWRCVMSKTH